MLSDTLVQRSVGQFGQRRRTSRKILASAENRNARQHARTAMLFQTFPGDITGIPARYCANASVMRRRGCNCLLRRMPLTGCRLPRRGSTCRLSGPARTEVVRFGPVCGVARCAIYQISDSRVLDARASPLHHRLCCGARAYQAGSSCQSVDTQCLVPASSLLG